MADRRGFTLIELLVALAVFSLAALALLNLSAENTRSASRVETRTLGGVVADPFGASMCLIIAGIFYSTKLYRLNIMTVGDYYRLRYNRTVEVITSLCIVVSYLGWVAAQIKAMGLIFFMVTDGAVSQETGMVLGALIVLTYTTFGGMFSVAILDFVQMAVSMGGLLYIAYIISGLTGGVAPVIAAVTASPGCAARAIAATSASVG